MLAFLQKIKELGVNFSVSPLCLLVPQENARAVLKQLTRHVAEVEDVAVNLREGQAELTLHLRYRMHFTIKLFLAPGTVEIQEDVARVELIQQKPPEIRGQNIIATKFLQNAFKIFRSRVYQLISRKVEYLELDNRRIRLEVPLQEYVSEKVIKIFRFVTIEKYTFEDQKIRLYLKIFPTT